MMDRLIHLKVWIRNPLGQIGRENMYNEKYFKILENLFVMLKATQHTIK